MHWTFKFDNRRVESLPSHQSKLIILKFTFHFDKKFKFVTFTLVPRTGDGCISVCFIILVLWNNRFFICVRTTYMLVLPKCFLMCSFFFINLSHISVQFSKANTIWLFILYYIRPVRSIQMRLYLNEIFFYFLTRNIRTEIMKPWWLNSNQREVTLSVYIFY